MAPLAPKLRRKASDKKNGSYEKNDDKGDIIEDEEQSGVDHAETLRALKENDPEFYAFLERNDKSLLDFDMAADIPDEDDDDDEEGSEDEESAEQGEEISDHESDKDGNGTEKKSQKSFVFNASKIDYLTKEMSQKHSLRAVKQFVSILSQVVSSKKDSKDTAGKQESGLSSGIIEADDFGSLIVHSVQTVPQTLNHHFAVSRTAESSQRRKLPSASSKWMKSRVLVKSWLTCLGDVLEQIVDPELLDFLFRAMYSNDAILYVACFGNNSLGKHFVRKISTIWCALPNHNGKSDSKVENLETSAKLGAYVLIRQLCVYSQASFMDLCLKNCYRSFLSVCSNTSPSNIRFLKFLANCLVDLYKIHEEDSYMNAFLFIRQLAIQLRNAITQLTAETRKRVLNWQVVHAIKFWCRLLGDVVSTAGKDSIMSKLVFPLVQVTFGVIRFAQGQQFYPLRMHLLDALTDLSAQTKVFIPIPGFCSLVMRELASLGRQKASSAKALDWSLNIRATKFHVGTQPFADEASEKFTQLLVRFCSEWSTSITFPEMAVPIISQLRKCCKESRNPKLIRACKGTLEKILETREYILDKRNTVDFAPSDLERCDEWSRGLDQSATPISLYWSSIKRIASLINN